MTTSESSARAAATGAQATRTPVFFVAGGTGISAQTLGNLLLAQFPGLSFVRRKIPFITTIEQARRVLEQIDATMTDTVTPLVFSTVSDEPIRLSASSISRLIPSRR